MSTRVELVPHCRIEPHGDRHRLIVDCGYETFAFAFLDIDDLVDAMEQAVRHKPHMPCWAVPAAIDYALGWLGSYEDREPCPFVNAFVPSTAARQFERTQSWFVGGLIGLLTFLVWFGFFYGD